MHRGHDHAADGATSGTHPDPGHNRAPEIPRATQWQTPHAAQDADAHGHSDGEPDFDLVEKAFVEAFGGASDPTSFLRLAQVPFEAAAADGAKLVLLRVEIEAVADVGAVMPHLGGASFRYDPLPASRVVRRQRLRFVYFDGQELRPLSLGEVQGLAEGDVGTAQVPFGR